MYIVGIRWRSRLLEKLVDFSPTHPHNNFPALHNQSNLVRHRPCPRSNHRRPCPRLGKRPTIPNGSSCHRTISIKRSHPSTSRPVQNQTYRHRGISFVCSEYDGRDVCMGVKSVWTVWCWGGRNGWGEYYYAEYCGGVEWAGGCLNWGWGTSFFGTYEGGEVIFLGSFGYSSVGDSCCKTSW